MFQGLRKLEDAFHKALFEITIGSSTVAAAASKHAGKIDAFIDQTVSDHPWIKNQLSDSLQRISQTHAANCPFNNPSLRDWWISKAVRKDIEDIAERKIQHRENIIQYEAEDAVEALWHEGPEAIAQYLRDVENGDATSKQDFLYAEYGITAAEILNHIGENYPDLLPQQAWRKDRQDELESQRAAQPPITFKPSSPFVS